jgi:hypothetical protein
MSASSCHFCANTNPSGAKFCNECGSPLHLKPCPRCEAITDATVTNCYQCGAPFDASYDTEAGATFVSPRDTEGCETFFPPHDTRTRVSSTSPPSADAMELDALDVEGVHHPDSLASCLDPDGRVDRPSERSDATLGARDGSAHDPASEYTTRAAAKRSPARAKSYRRVAALLIAPVVVAAGLAYYRHLSVTSPSAPDAVVAKRATETAPPPVSALDVKRVEPPASPKAGTDLATARGSATPVQLPPVGAGQIQHDSIAPAVAAFVPGSLPRKTSAPPPPPKPSRTKNAQDPAALATQRLIARDLANFRRPADPSRTTPSKPE